MPETNHGNPASLWKTFSKCSSVCLIHVLKTAPDSKKRLEGMKIPNIQPLLNN